VRRDYFAGLLVCSVAIFMGYFATTYNVGSIRNIGPGFFPFFLSIALFIVGLLIAVNAAPNSAPVSSDTESLDHFAEGASQYPDIRGGIAIVLGMVAFVLLTQTLGFVAGTFACVFIAALGDRSASLLGSVLLAALVTVCGAGIFIYFLKLNLPLFTLQGFSL
jgi:putative tricarboxylic transport membrane protein